MTSFNNCLTGEPVVWVDPKQAKMWAEMPAAARHLADTCQKVHGTSPKFYRSEYIAEFQLSADRIMRGNVQRSIQVVAGIQGVLQPALQKLVTAGSRMCLLSADVEECTAALLPVPVTWRLDLVPRAGESLQSKALAAKLPFDPQSHVPRSFVALAGQNWRAPSHDAREALITEPLVYSDETYSITFAATEAWGFDSGELLREVAEPSGDGFYFVPVTYPFSSLLARVHSCIVLANAQREHNALYALTMPAAAFTLQGTTDGWEISAGDLSAAIEFIEQRLVPALVVVSDPAQLTLTVKPFGAQRWSEVWARHQKALAMAQATNIKMPAGAAISREIKCSLRIVAFFVDLNDSNAPRNSVGNDGEARVSVLPNGVMQVAPYDPPRPTPVTPATARIVEVAAEYSDLPTLRAAAAAANAATNSTADLALARGTAVAETLLAVVGDGGAPTTAAVVGASTAATTMELSDTATLSDDSETL